MKPLYLTCYNAPEKCRDLLASFRKAGHLQGRAVILSNQSSEEFISLYNRICAEFGCEHVLHENAGATRAKRSVVEHATHRGYDIIHQLSEDFVFADHLCHPCLPSALPFFLRDSEEILEQMLHLDFVKWCLYTGIDGDMSYVWNGGEWFGRTGQINIRKGVITPFITGSLVQFTNWPATWRVQSVLNIWQEADKWTPPNQLHEDQIRISGGEWAASHCGTGSGAILIAQPVRHPDRIKPSGSLP